MVEPQESQAANFEQAGKRIGRPYQEPTGNRLQMNAVVADQPCKTEPVAACRRDQFARQPRLAGAGPPTDQHRSRTDQDCRGMDSGRCHPPSHRRQAHDKSRTNHCRLAVRARSASAVFDPDRAAVGVDDLLRDGKAQTGILAESLMRPVGIETLENLIEYIGPHAWTVVIDENFDLATQTPAGDAHRAAGWRK